MPFPALPVKQDRAIQLTRQLGVYSPGWYPAADCAASRALALLLATHGFNNPVNTVDPSGHYGKDVHSDKTREESYNLAYKFMYDKTITNNSYHGLNEYRAEEIANRKANNFATTFSNQVVIGDMAADSQTPDGNPLVTLQSLLDVPVFSPNIFYVQPHWYTTPQAEEALAEATNPYDFGYSLHKYQDSFAHWQKLGKPDTALGIYALHARDIVNKNTPVSIDYFSYTNTIDQNMLTGMRNAIEQFLITNY